MILNMCVTLAQGLRPFTRTGERLAKTINAGERGV